MTLNGQLASCDGSGESFPSVWVWWRSPHWIPRMWVLPSLISLMPRQNANCNLTWDAVSGITTRLWNSSALISFIYRRFPNDLIFSVTTQDAPFNFTSICYSLHPGEISFRTKVNVRLITFLFSSSYQSNRNQFGILRVANVSGAKPRHMCSLVLSSHILSAFVIYTDKVLTRQEPPISTFHFHVYQHKEWEWNNGRASPIAIRHYELRATVGCAVWLYFNSPLHKHNRLC